MCFSFKSSIIAYLIALVSAIVAFSTKQYVLGSLISSYAQMQLAEAFIWYGINNKNENINKMGTSYGKYLLTTHNIAIGIGIYMYNGNIIPLIVGILFSLIIMLCVYLPQTYSDVTYPKQPCNDKICDNPDNRLNWPWPHKWYFISYILSIILVCLFMSFNTTYLLTIGLLTMTYIMSFLLYPNTMGSVWCYSASLMAPLFILCGIIF